MRKVFLSVVVCIAHSVLLAQQNSYKEKTLQTIYSTISKASGDLRQPPSLIFDYKTGKKTCLEAYYNPENKSIHVGEGIYDLCASLQQDSTNAMAFVLAHELVHYCKDHGWGISFGTLLDDPELLKTLSANTLSLEKKIECEGQADYTGLMYTYLAGYSSYKAAGNFLEKLYTAKGIKNSVPGYPDKSTRLTLLEDSRKKIEALIPYFESGNLLQLMEEYEVAALCYQKIAEYYPAKEIFNNAGVCYAKEALRYFKTSEFPYLLPYGFEINSSLYTTGNKGIPIQEDPIRFQTRNNLLAKAQTMFEKALQLDKNYTLATLHLGMTYLLEQNEPLAYGYLSNGLKLAITENSKMTKSNAYIALGIYAAVTKDREAAMSNFTLGEKENPEIARYNKCIFLENKCSPSYLSGKEAPLLLEEETISNVSISELSFTSKNSLLKLAPSDKKELNISILFEPKKTFTLLEVKIVREKQFTTYHFIATNEQSNYTTEKGIRKNDDTKKLIQLYGNPTTKQLYSNGFYYKYDSPGLLFNINASNKITSWIFFTKQ